jgi:hypothetical protein
MSVWMRNRVVRERKVEKLGVWNPIYTTRKACALISPRPPILSALLFGYESVLAENRMEMKMSNQEMQPSTQELGMSLMEELEANKQVIEGISDGELEAVAGGALPPAIAQNWGKIGGVALGAVGAVSLAVSASAQQRQAKALDKQNKAYGI